MLIYGPLAHGLLTGKYSAEVVFPATDWRSKSELFRGETLRRNVEVVRKLGHFAAVREVGLPLLAIAWTLANPAVDVAIVGARTALQIEQTAPAAELHLAPRDFEDIDHIMREAVAVGGPLARVRLMLGFIGLGYLGSRTATRLLQAGHAIGVYNRTAEKARPLADLGARVYCAPAHLAGEADVVFSMLTDDAAVEKVMIGPEGVLAGAHHGLTIVDLSSVHPETSRQVASAATLRDVPISTHRCLGALSRQRRGAW